MHRIFISAALAIAALLPAAAQAQPGDTYLVTMPVRGLDLASPAGAAVLRSRATRIADTACGSATGLEAALAARKCRKQFMAKVETRIALKAAQSRMAMASR